MPTGDCLEQVHYLGFSYMDFVVFKLPKIRKLKGKTSMYPD